MSKTECQYNNNLYIKPLESCTFGALYRYNNNNNGIQSSSTIFADSIKRRLTDINSNFRDPTTNEYIYKYNNDKKDLCFPLKENDPNSPYAINCVIATGNPLYTYDKNKRACVVLPELSFTPDKFSFSENKDYIYLKPLDKNEIDYTYKKRLNKAFCENKWMDWIITPNYHFGNSYYKDSGDYTIEDVKKCYAPCSGSKLPYVDINGNHKCVNKKIADNGIYNNKLDFSPIALINLLGNTKKNYSLLYIYMTLYEYEKITVTNNYEKIPEALITNSNCKININTGVYSSDNSDCAIDKKSYNLFNEVRDTYSDLSNSIFLNILNLTTFDSIKNYKDHPEILTYKNINFNEDNPNQLTLRGMINYNILSDPILIHTYILSSNIHKYSTTTIFNITDGLNGLEKNDNNDIIIENNKILETNIKNLQSNEYNVNYILDEILNINNIYKNETPDNKIKYKERLANILYKAINICYDNKTEFSKNIILKTKEAFKKLTTNNSLVESLVKLTYLNDNSYQNTSNVHSLYYTADRIVINADVANKITYYNTYLNSLDSGLLIEYYNSSIVIDEIYNKLTNTKSPTINSIYKQKIDDFFGSLLFFKMERLEDVCSKPNEIYNKVTKTCVSCDSYCTYIKDDKTTTCETIPDCKKYCKNRCEGLPTPTTSPINRKTTCGTITSKESKTSTQTPKDNETLVGEDSFDIFIQLYGGIKMTLSFVFIAVIIYILYIFYEVFGEAILIFFNFCIYYIYLTFIILGNINIRKFGFDWARIDFVMAEFIKNRSIKNFDKVSIGIYAKS